MNEFKKNNKETPLSEAIDQFLKIYQLDNKMIEIKTINAWKEIMGISVANRTRSISIKNKVLHLQIDSSVMREELLYGKNIIINKVNQYAGKELINDIWFA